MDESTSPAFTELSQVVVEAFYNSGRLFTRSSDGITSQLVRLLTEHGFQDILTKPHTVVYRAGTENGQFFYEDMSRWFRVLLPFFQKWTRVPDDYQQLYEELLSDMQQPDFVATGTHLTVWGTRPPGQSPLLRGLN